MKATLTQLEPLGRVYLVDLDDVQGATCIDVLMGRQRRVQVIRVLEPTPGYLPLEALTVAADS